eukprot:gnl/Chilomastix_cuspidata/2242.p1 GENE.gnl/Chilomastix_cuspidata/2242~~gnl/Chilomastix_cuspidata/2242.p1  ORF type:complete len:459 (-),score=142.45 gnl/Chilomastix_cuspidata/2242:604-1980(-)
MHASLPALPRNLLVSAEYATQQLPFAQKKMISTRAQLAKSEEDLATFRGLPAISESCSAAEKIFSDASPRLLSLAALCRAPPLARLLEGLAESIYPPSSEAEAVRRGVLVAQAQTLTEELRAKFDVLSERTGRLTVVSGLKTMPNEPEEWHAVWDTVQEFCGAADSVETFSAYPGVAELDFVVEALMMSTRPFNGIRVSLNVTPTRGLPEDLDARSVVALSSSGILCVGVGTRLQVFDLVSRRDATLRGGESMFGLVAKGELFVCWRGQSTMRYAPIEQVLQGLSIAHFSRFELAAPFHSSPCLDRASDGWFLFLSGPKDANLVLVHPSRRKSRVLPSGRPFSSVSGFTSIRVPGALCVAADRRGACFMVSPNGTLVPLSALFRSCVMLFPSAAAPADLALAALLDSTHGLSFRGHKKPLEKLLQPARGTQLVRLYQDVFLCVQPKTRRFAAMRIVVP